MNHSDGGAKKSAESDANADAPATGFFTPNDKIDFSNVKIEPLFDDMVDNHIPAGAKLY